MASISARVDGQLAVAGVLDHFQSAGLREQGRQLLKACTSAAVVLDFTEVERANSAGLSLILCLMRDAQALGKQLSVTHLPVELRQLAQVSGLQQVLALG